MISITKRKSLMPGLMLAAAAGMAALPCAAEELITFFHNDVLGTAHMSTDAAGNLLWKDNYLPFGVSLNQQDNGDQIRFAGKPFERATGLSYLGMRYYDPAIGRFTGIDPKGVDENDFHGFNRYAYGDNNPYKNFDPDGRAVESIHLDKNNNVRIVIAMSYKGITPAQIADNNAAIVAAFSGKKGKYAVDVTVVPEKGSTFANFVTVNGGSGSAETNGNGGRKTTMYRTDSLGASFKDVLLHEVGHEMGAQHQYSIIRGVATPNPGYENSIMGNTMGGSVTEKDINLILDYHFPNKDGSRR